jgi:hypothetical protein
MREPAPVPASTAAAAAAVPEPRNAEGPTVFKSNTEKKYYLFVDEFGGRGYIPLESTSLENPDWKLSTNYELPRAPRHGTVLPVTKTELERLRGQLG